jgi:hypothetical protein
MTCWIARVERYLPWGARQAICDQAPVDPYGLSRIIYSRSREAKACASLR